MLIELLIAFVLVAITVILHVLGIVLLLSGGFKASVQSITDVKSVIWLLVRASWWMIVLHLLEICVWGFFYLWRDCLPDLNTAFYFSGVTYATIGYGDVVLPKPWQWLGPIEGLTGILMCGLSASVFFAIVTRIYAARAKAIQETE